MQALLVGLFFLVRADAAEAQKTDSVWIQNGDHITGEIKSLSRARLEYSTDDLGTIYIEWDNVERITSPATFEVQLTSGKKFYGPLGLAPDGLVVVEADTLPLREIVEIAPIKGSLLARLSGYFDLGFSYQKAHETLQLTTGTKVMYRGTLVETTFEFSTFIEDRDDAAETSRLSTGIAR